VPQSAWKDKAAFEVQAKKLAGMFAENFKKYADGVTEEVRAAGPKV
jgi:phosphoenolpyruvate carboxykinase (ATP)